MESIFSKMTRLCLEHNALNLAQGFPDFDVQPEIVEIASKVYAENNHQYAPAQGLPELRSSIAQLINKNYAADRLPEDILVTSGATEGLFATFMALINPGDEVLLFDPCYDSYVPAIERAGGVAVRIPLVAPEFNYQFKDYTNYISSKTKFVVINNPHNPLGKVLDKDAFEEFKKFVLENNLTVISDEVYEFISFKKHFSVLEDEELRNRAVVISSFGKTLHLTGWKVGYLSAPKQLLSKILNIHQFLVFSVHRPAQLIIHQFLEQSNYDVSPKLLFEQKKDLMEEVLKEKFELLPADGTYFQIARFTSETMTSDVAYCEWLVKEKGIGAIPVSVFYENGLDQQLIRFCFAKKEDTLEKAKELVWKI